MEDCGLGLMLRGIRLAGWSRRVRTSRNGRPVFAIERVPEAARARSFISSEMALIPANMSSRSPTSSLDAAPSPKLCTWSFVQMVGGSGFLRD